MEGLFCDKYSTSIFEFEDLHSTYIANCVFNSFLTYTAIMLNIVTIHVMRKTSSLPTTLRTLLLSLAVSDVGVGLFVQPFYTSLLVHWLQQNHPSCYTHVAFKTIGLLFSTSSFLGVVAVSVDRFLAVHLHLKYQELVTHKRVVAVVISLWILSAFASVITLWDLHGAQWLSLYIIGAIGLLLSAVIYFRIYLIVRRHKNQIQALQVQPGEQTSEMANFAVLVKSAVSIFYVFFVFLVCFLPSFVSLAVINSYLRSENNSPSIAIKRFSLFSLTLMFLNSSLNPVIYCWKMRHIRHAIVNILRNMFWNRNHRPH